MSDVGPGRGDGPGPGRRDAAIAGHEGELDLAQRLLEHPDAGTRATALAALSRMGKMATATLRVALADPSPVVRRRAVVLAVAHPTISLIPLLGDADDTVVEAAAYACGERRPAEPGVVANLAAVATDHADGLCREAAVAALGALGDASGLSAILAATRDRATVRRRAVLALAPFTGPEVDAALARAMADRDWQVRQAAEDIGAATGTPDKDP